MTMQAFLKEWSELLEEDLEKVDLNIPLNTLSNWDSIEIVSTIALIDEHFNIQVSGDNIKKCTTLKQIIDLIHETRSVHES